MTNIADIYCSSLKYKRFSFSADFIINSSVVILTPTSFTSSQILNTSAFSTPIGFVKNSISNVKPYLALSDNGDIGISTIESPDITNALLIQPFSLLKVKLDNIVSIKLSSWSIPCHISLLVSEFVLSLAVPINIAPVLVGSSIA